MKLEKIIALLVMSIAFWSCQHTMDFTEQELDLPIFQENATTQEVSFSIEQATLTFNGKVLSEKLTLKQDNFGFFFLWVKDQGLFVITIFPLSIAVHAGNFTGNTVAVEYLDHKIELTSQSDHIFNDAQDRGAYLIYIEDYKIFSPGVKPADTVIGAVSELRQIPRFSN